MGVIWSALTSKTCVNCVCMPEGYYCKKLKKRFDGHKIDEGFVPCEGEESLYGRALNVGIKRLCPPRLGDSLHALQNPTALCCGEHEEDRAEATFW